MIGRLLAFKMLSCWRWKAFAGLCEESYFGWRQVSSRGMEQSENSKLDQCIQWSYIKLIN